MHTFIETIYSFYRQNKREFAWRDTDNAYYVFVSEVMLQQTQTSRVIEKFEQFIIRFPTLHDLACADLADVLLVWQGLGYNRRGRFLHESAQSIVRDHAGIIPDDPEILVTLPGIGKATAASIAAFAYNKPTVFIETNIRAVFIHYFFQDRHDVEDRELLPLIEQSLDTSDPRQWYYALMDYGVYLKKHCPNPSRKSAHHTKQSKFDGSLRQVRGAIMRVLLGHTSACAVDVVFSLVEKDLRRSIQKPFFEKALAGLAGEKMVVVRDGSVCV
jgi:A/G-specific adenine glycosylase